MAIQFVQELGSSNNAKAGAPWFFWFTSTPAAGNRIVVVVVADTQPVDVYLETGNYPMTLDASSDNAGNVFVGIYSRLNDLSFSGFRVETGGGTAQAAVAFEVSGVAETNYLGNVGQWSGSGFNVYAPVVAGLAGQLAVGAAGFEGPSGDTHSAQTGDPEYLDHTLTKAGTFGSGAASNVTVVPQWTIRAADGNSKPSIVSSRSGDVAGAVAFYKPAGGATQRQATLTAKAAIKKAVPRTLTAKAAVKKSSAATLTAKAAVVRRNSATLTTKAYIKGRIARTLTGRAAIKKTTPQTLTAKGVVLRRIPTTFTAKAAIRRSPATTLAAKAVVRRSIATALTAKASIAGAGPTPHSATLTAKAAIFRRTSTSFAAKAWITKTGTETLYGIPTPAPLPLGGRIRETGSLAAKAAIRRTAADTLASKAVIRRIVATTLAGKAAIRTSAATTLVAKASITPAAATPRQATLGAKAVVRRSVTTGLTGKAVIRRSASGSLVSKAVVRRTAAGTLTAKAYLKGRIASTLSAKAVIRRTSQTSLTAKAAVRRSPSSSVAAKAVIRISPSLALDAKAVVLRASQTSLAAKAVIGRIGRCAWTTPGNGDNLPDSTPTLAFTMPSAIGPMHFQLDLDTVNTFDSGNLRHYRSHMDQTGWEYWNGEAWASVPSTGVPAAYAGNEARFTVPTGLSGGVWYRRVRGGA